LEKLGRFVTSFNIPVIGDCISNIHALKSNYIAHQDLILRSKEDEQKILSADLIISFGKSTISKNLKLFLRKHKPLQHWHLQASGYVADTFQSLTVRIRMQPKDFFHQATTYFQGKNKTDDYLKVWREKEIETSRKMVRFFPTDPISEIGAAYEIVTNLPDNTHLHLANSMPVRLVNLTGPLKPGIEVFSNRGVSGIDGCTSTAVGISMQSDNMNILITGDMAFFYDRNALWHDYLPGNLRIVILNNHGGGIFRLIDGPSELPELKEFFETDQKLTARNTAADFGMEYLFSNDKTSIQENLHKLLVDDGKAKILEIETDSQTNKIIFEEYISQFK
jgi:2-succinyl-5-enolpyruvyl-6-hydroxy-3-cyclohexene-1-carboxylate synthase